MKRIRTVLVWVLSVLIAMVMILQGWPKFSESGRWAVSFAEWGYPAWFRMFVGAMEIGGALALLIPRVAHYGASLLALVMVGAVGTLILHERGADAVTPLVYVVLLVWIAWERRSPAVSVPASQTN